MWNAGFMISELRKKMNRKRFHSKPQPGKCLMQGALKHVHHVIAQCYCPYVVYKTVDTIATVATVSTVHSSIIRYM